MKHRQTNNGSLRKREITQPQQHTEYYLFNSQGNLKAYSDDIMDFAYYGYNAANTRTYKLSLYNTNIWINGQQEPLNMQLQQAMFYPNTYLNFNGNGEYTKHYYNGTERIASRLGDNTTTIALNNNILEARKLQLEEQFREDIHKLIEETVPIDLPPFIDVNALQPTGTPNDIYYYHPNHLGSTAFVTDQNQTITQGFLYAPFGEITTEYAPMWQNCTLPKYAFNAKELDEETEMYYYEARYYKPPVFISRDPMYENYPTFSPYTYCANNPVKYVDPDGKLPIIPWLLKAGAGAAADMMAQASLDYLFNPNTHSWGQAFDNINWWQVARSGAEGLIPWKTPGGKIGKAAGTAIVDVLVNGANDPANYTAEQAGMDFVIGFIGDLAGGGFGQIIDKYGSKAVINGLMDKLNYSATQIRKVTGGFDGDAVRKWYKESVEAININIAPTEANARSVVNQRNTLKQQARDLMSNQKAASKLPKIQSYEYYYQKAYNAGYRGEELYRHIINGSTKTNKSFNKRYGE